MPAGAEVEPPLLGSRPPGAWRLGAAAPPAVSAPKLDEGPQRPCSCTGGGAGQRDGLPVAGDAAARRRLPHPPHLPEGEGRRPASRGPSWRCAWRRRASAAPDLRRCRCGRLTSPGGEPLRRARRPGRPEEPRRRQQGGGAGEGVGAGRRTVTPVGQPAGELGPPAPRRTGAPAGARSASVGGGDDGLGPGPEWSHACAALPVRQPAAGSRRAGCFSQMVRTLLASW